MPLEISIRGLGGSEEAQDAQRNGVLDPEQVMYQFVCTTEDGGHDPDGTPDDHVRPSHAALHGTLWAVGDPIAPIPPLDWGCRCALSLRAKQGTLASRVLGADATTSEPPEASPVESYRAWLDENVPQWKEIAKAASEAPPAERLQVAYLAARALGIPQARDIARMASEASPFKAKPLNRDPVPEPPATA